MTALRKSKDIGEILEALTIADVDQAVYERSFYKFVKAAWSVLEPSTKFIDGRHIACKCEYLEAVTLGQIQFLIINEPPRHMKSLTTTVMWPCWEWITKAHLRYLFTSYSGELSNTHSMHRRTLIESDWYQSFWADKFSLRHDNNRKTEFENDRTGIMTSTSTGATATGKGGNRIIIDDPLNPEQALSDVERPAANTYFDQTLYTRLNDKVVDSILLIMQRLHQKDLTGHLLQEKKEMGWVHLNLQAEAERRTIISLPISKSEWVREEGDVLWPKKESKAMLDIARVALGSYAYGGQYQQTPSPTEGGLIDKSWWRRYVVRPLSLHRVIMSVDAAFKDLKTSSFVCVQVWGEVGADIYLLECARIRIDFVKTVKLIITIRNRWIEQGIPISAILVEDKANGTAIISSLKSKIRGIIAVEPRGNKNARAVAHSPTIEAGNVFIPEGLEGDIFIDEWSMIPYSEFMDQVDAGSQAFDYLSLKMTILGLEQMNNDIPAMESANADW